MDLLGFSDVVDARLDEAMESYDRIFAQFKSLSPDMFPTLEISVASDSVVLSSPILGEVLAACHGIQFQSLCLANTLVRGGVAYGHLDRLVALIQAELHRG